MTTFIRQAVTALLDTPGVHPGNDNWYAADEVFWTTLRSWDNNSLDTAANAALTRLGIDDDGLRITALARFHDALTQRATSRATDAVRHGARSIGHRVRDGIRQLSAPAQRTHQEGGGR